jgi:hypothetical protein
LPREVAANSTPPDNDTLSPTPVICKYENKNILRIFFFLSVFYLFWVGSVISLLPLSKQAQAKLEFTEDEPSNSRAQIQMIV